MASSNVDDKLKNDTENKETGNKTENSGTNKILMFIKQNVRYITAGVLFLALVLILVKAGSPKQSQNGQDVAATEVTSEASNDAVQEFEVDAYEDVNTLINQYYTAYAAGDTDTLQTIATPLSENEKSYISVFSQYVDAYQNIKCYTKQGLDASSYLVSVYVEVKFKDVDTVAPGLDFFYVRTNDDGSVYIDNLYSQYNLKIKENALDTSIQNLISEYEGSEDVNSLQKEVQDKYDTAVASDDKLSEMIQTTIPNAITEWAGTIVSQNTETESTEQQVPEETTEAEQSETPEENTDQPEENGPTQSEPDTVYAVDTVNVRAAADTESEKLGTLEQGTALTRTGTDGEWSIVNYNGQTGYIKTEYLTTKNADSEADNGQTDNGGNDEQTSAGDFIAEGTVITLKDSVNVRSGMSESDSKIGTAFTGEKVTVVMSYAEGWTKVTWNGQTGYIKTSLLQ
ncbi:SH3 domain-containing protein [Roseburia rectibacter]|uniref:SH3 domain-containing protein n=1 Tax=Roseburia rectibacter TaxID=2763062 RepID=UPI001F137AFB|nr:SH3 domain-containing protein [Roseburia rectibacter]UMY98905.1 SH3 domain-containing protein [Roseburia rectibacter]